jgi:DNA-binding XRE family transcriptional regulator
MVKSAQEWQEALNLDTLPDADLLAMLNAAEGQGDLYSTAPSAETPLDVDNLAETIESLYQEEVIATAVGQALAQLRAAEHLTLAQVGDAMQVTRARVSSIEKGENAKLDTVARYAAAVGYRARLVLEPAKPGGPRITLDLTQQVAE